MGSAVGGVAGVGGVLGGGEWYVIIVGCHSFSKGALMTEIATVVRYCSIEDTVCNKQIPYHGTWTFFCAYPSGPQWSDFMAELVTELEFRSISCTRWEDLIKSDLLFSKVCEGIYSHDYLLAEVTDPNPNVLLEIGYALAVGRQPILLKNRNMSDWSRNLLTTLEGCYYSTREDIYEHLARIISDDREIPETPNRRLPYLDNMGIFDHEEDPGTVYHLKPKLTADWISRIDRTLKNSYFKPSITDPSDSVYDEFYPQARQIQGASLIVASLVSQKYRHWQQHNANVSLLIGFAIGLGKRVLVLHEEPLTPILDLGSVTRTFKSETEAENIVKGWLDQEPRSVVRRRQESQSKAAAHERTARMRQVYMGPPDALQDNRLLDYFVPTNEFENAIRGQRTIYLGRRGSGKSANVQAIKSELEGNAGTIVAEIAPDDFELERISEFLKTDYALVNSTLLFQTIWNYTLTTEIVKAIAKTTDHLYQTPNGTTRGRLRRYVNANQDLLDKDFGSRVIHILDDVIDASPTVSDSNRQSNAEEAVKSIRDYELGRLLRDFVFEEKLEIFLVADDLDKHWRPDTKQSIDLLVGLIAEVDRLQRYFKGSLKIVLFLREDIYDVLTRYDDDLPKRNYLRLDWSHDNLKHLVAERLAVSVGEINDNDDETWAMVFSEPVDGNAASDYIISHALPRPRDVLDLCQKSIDHAQRNGHDAVTAADIKAGEQSFSDGLFWSLSTEFRGLYPDLEYILFELAGIEEMVPWKEFYDISNKAIEKNENIFPDWVVDGEMDPRLLADVLFSIGVIGLSRSLSNDPYFCNGRSFNETWNFVSPSPVVHIHPAFKKVLEVSAVMPRNSRSSRGRRRVDPRQLTLE